MLNSPLERLYIDTLSYFHHNQSNVDDVVIIGIDETSFQAMDMQWPWPREVHGELVNEISKFNPKSIVFDVVFSEPSNDESDNHFAQAISDSKKVILASDLSVRESAFMTGVVETRPLELFEKAGARVGFVLMATIMSMALGGWSSGLIYDLSGSYQLAFINGIAWNGLNITIMLWLLMRGRPRNLGQLRTV
mgnify:CR=1 FL=1